MDCDSKSMWFRTLGVRGRGEKEGRRHEGSIEEARRRRRKKDNGEKRRKVKEGGRRHYPIL